MVSRLLASLVLLIQPAVTSAGLPPRTVSVAPNLDRPHIPLVRASRRQHRAPLHRWQPPQHHGLPVVGGPVTTRTKPAPITRSHKPTSSGTASTADRRSPVATSLRSDLARALALPEPWRSIVRCESIRDGSWRVSAASYARGWFQFLRSTWRSLGLAGDPAAASFATQYAAARRLAARDGLANSWVCARQLGWG